MSTHIISTKFFIEKMETIHARIKYTFDYNVVIRLRDTYTSLCILNRLYQIRTKCSNCCKPLYRRNLLFLFIKVIETFHVNGFKWLVFNSTFHLFLLFCYCQGILKIEKIPPLEQNQSSYRFDDDSVPLISKGNKNCLHIFSINLVAPLRNENMN